MKRQVKRFGDDLDAIWFALTSRGWNDASLRPPLRNSGTSDTSDPGQIGHALRFLDRDVYTTHGEAF